MGTFAMKPAEQITRPDLWDRQPGEPARWFARFSAFLALGPGRSLNASARAEQGDGGKVSEGAERRAAGAWQRTAQRWRWRERAEAWDKGQADRERDALEDERREERRARRALLRTARQKVERALGSLEPETWREAVYSLRIIAGEQRIEYGERDGGPGAEEELPGVIILPPMEDAPQ